MLEKLANVAVITAAVVMLSTVAYDRVIHPSSTPRRPAPAVGTHLPLPLSPEVRLGRYGSVVLFVSSQCRYCSASMPFYRSLASIQESAPGDFSVIGVVPSGKESREKGEQYFKSSAVNIAGVAVIDFEKAGTSATPTLLLVDGNRRVVGAWVGQLSPEKEVVVKKEIVKLCRTCTIGS